MADLGHRENVLGNAEICLKNASMLVAYVHDKPYIGISLHPYLDIVQNPGNHKETILKLNGRKMEIHLLSSEGDLIMHKGDGVPIHSIGYIDLSSMESVFSKPSGDAFETMAKRPTTTDEIDETYKKIVSDFECLKK